jgi:hypothetical protein
MMAPRRKAQVNQSAESGRVLSLLRVFLEPTALGPGPIRMEAWSEREWTG